MTVTIEELGENGSPGNANFALLILLTPVSAVDPIS